MLTDLAVRQAKAAGKPYGIADFDDLSPHASVTGSKAYSAVSNVDNEVFLL
jgi:hypothetical protein